MAAPHLGPISPEEYLRMERQAETRHELVNGVVYAMNGVSRWHNRLVDNLHFLLRRALPKSCECFVSDMRVGIPNTGQYTYPDLAIVCGEANFEDAQVDTLTNPIVLIEVLSSSTEVCDRGAKFLHYRTIPSLEAYLLVSQGHAQVEARVKNEAGEWIHHVSLGRSAEMSLPALGLSIPLEILFEGIEVPETVPGRLESPRG
jgi:Uma2 family endonuclease